MEWKDAISGLSKDERARDALKKLLIKVAYLVEDLQSTFTAKLSVLNGDRLGWVGDMSAIGWEGSTCKPEYKTPTTEVAEKTWEIGKWQVPLEYCFTDYEETIAEYALKGGKDIGDLTDTEIWNVLISNPLTAALIKMYWRVIWFGDTQAANLTDGTDTSLFTVCDGLWKRLTEVATDNSAQYTEIAANSEATTAEQKKALFAEGVATKLFDTILLQADSRIIGLPGAAIYCTKSLADALTYDLREKYHIQMDWSLIENGLHIGSYNGVKIVPLSIWDRLIAEYFNAGDTLVKPNRAFFGSPEQLFVGTPANSIVSELDVFFSQKERTTNIYTTGKIGTLVGEDTLFQIAY